jgi:hypothetical protein
MWAESLRRLGDPFVGLNTRRRLGLGVWHGGFPSAVGMRPGVLLCGISTAVGLGGAVAVGKLVVATGQF